jgi:hypothetical protein
LKRHKRGLTLLRSQLDVIFFFFLIETFLSSTIKFTNIFFFLKTHTLAAAAADEFFYKLIFIKHYTATSFYFMEGSGGTVGG